MIWVDNWCIPEDLLFFKIGIILARFKDSGRIPVTRYWIMRLEIGIMIVLEYFLRILVGILFGLIVFLRFNVLIMAST